MAHLNFPKRHKFTAENFSKFDLIARWLDGNETLISADFRRRFITEIIQPDC